MQTAYTNLLMKREDAVVAANLEGAQIGERFRLVDRALKPERPYNYVERRAIMASGAIAGLALGVLAAGLLEYRDSSFRSADEVQKALSLPVLASIPTMASENERRTTRLRRWALDAGGVMLLLVAGAVIAAWRLQR
jgi:hypothetical protein